MFFTHHTLTGAYCVPGTDKACVQPLQSSHLMGPYQVEVLLCEAQIWGGRGGGEEYPSGIRHEKSLKGVLQMDAPPPSFLVHL